MRELPITLYLIPTPHRWGRKKKVASTKTPSTYDVNLNRSNKKNSKKGRKRTPSRKQRGEQPGQVIRKNASPPCPYAQVVRQTPSSHHPLPPSPWPSPPSPSYPFSCHRKTPVLVESHLHRCRAEAEGDGTVAECPCPSHQTWIVAVGVGGESTEAHR